MHRIGRTGRSNNKGTSYTFFTQTNGGKVDELVNILQETNQVYFLALNIYLFYLIIVYFWDILVRQSRIVST